MQEASFEMEQAAEHLRHRLETQIEIAGSLHIDENHMFNWLDEHAKLFADIEKNDPELASRVREGKITPEDKVYLRAMLDEYDLGEEDHTPGPELDA